MSNWTFAGDVAGSQIRIRGILELRLTETDQQVGPYTRFKCEVHLRSGVSIRRITTGTTLVTLDVRAKSDFLARFEAEHQAEKWLKANLDALCEGK